MQTAIILHGMPSKDEYYNLNYPSASNSHWLPWLQKKLLVKDIKADTPEVPHAYDPHYPTWLNEFERFDATSDTMLVGHSLGAGFIVRWLSEHPDVRVGKVVLVAPGFFIDWEGTVGDFFNFKIDPDLVSRTKGMTVFNSDNDGKVVQDSVQRIRAEIKDVTYREFRNYGHFCLKDMGTVEFPELVQELTGSSAAEQ